MASDSFKDDNQDWDLVWYYTMGDPLENGFKLPPGATNNYPSEITEDGLHFDYTDIGSLYQIVPKNYTTCNEGIYEIEVKIIRNNASNGQGLRLQLTNGTEGIGIYMITNNIIQYNNGGQNVYIDIGSYNLNEWFKFRIELSNNTAYVYLNNNLMHQTTTLSKGYMTSGNRFLVQGAIECYVRNIKIKKIS